MNVDGSEVRLSSENLSQRLLAAVRDKESLTEAFSFELSAVVPSIFYDDGQMRKNNKAELMNVLLIPGKVDTYSQTSHHVFDGCAKVYDISWPKVGKLSDLYQLYLESLSNESSEATVIFDNYTSKTTKALEQKRRKGNVLATDIDVKMNTPIPTDREKFLSSKTNKQKLIDMFSSLLTQAGVTVKHALEDGDADTLIVSEALLRAKTGPAVSSSFGFYCARRSC